MRVAHALSSRDVTTDTLVSCSVCSETPNTNGAASRPPPLPPTRTTTPPSISDFGLNEALVRTEDFEGTHELGGKRFSEVISCPKGAIIPKRGNNCQSFILEHYEDQLKVSHVPISLERWSGLLESVRHKKSLPRTQNRARLGKCEVWDEQRSKQIQIYNGASDANGEAGVAAGVVTKFARHFFTATEANETHQSPSISALGRLLRLVVVSRVSWQ